MAAIQNIRRCHAIGELLPVFLEQHRVRAEHVPQGADALDGDMTIEAIPTWYAGVTFRSRLEADWAATLDSLGIRWQYEPESINLPSGTVYIPDFWLPELGTWIEVKGTGVPRVEKAIELGESRACRCEGDCTCEWPGGQLVLVGHPPQPYNVFADPDYAESSWRFAVRRAWRRPGHPAWSSAHGRPALLARCNTCGRACWFTRPWCRACDKRLAGTHAYQSGATELEFVNSTCQPAPIAESEAA